MMMWRRQELAKTRKGRWVSEDGNNEIVPSMGFHVARHFLWTGAGDTPEDAMAACDSACREVAALILRGLP